MSQHYSVLPRRQFIGKYLCGIICVFHGTRNKPNILNVNFVAWVPFYSEQESRYIMKDACLLWAKSIYTERKVTPGESSWEHWKNGKADVAAPDTLHPHFSKDKGHIWYPQCNHDMSPMIVLVRVTILTWVVPRLFKNMSNQKRKFIWYFCCPL